MMLRVPPGCVPSISVALAASLALALPPAMAQSAGNSFADTTTQSSPYHGQVVEEIIANVNDQVISRSDYQRAEQELEQEARQQGWTEQQMMEQRRDLLRSLIDRQLLLSKGKEMGIDGETQLVKRLDEMRKQYHLATIDELQKAAEAQGVSFEDLKEQIRDNIITSDVIGQEVGQHIEVAPSEIQDYYNTHRQEFEHPEEVRLSEILIPTPNADDAAQVAEAQKKAEGIEDRLKAGADFATVAKADSGGPTAAQGGDLGEFKPGQLAKVLEEAAFPLEAGQHTAPIRTRQGWLILEVTQREKAGLAPLAEVQGQIQEQVGMRKMEPAVREYLTKLRNEAYIDIRSGYVDSGATPNEQKIIQSAYAPPQAKKKKHEDRTRYRQIPVRGKKQTEKVSARGGAPAGVPTLDQVNGRQGKSAEVASGTQKPGKKEKIRFGQAPRETLPKGETRMVDAGAGPTQPSGSNLVALTNAQGDVIDTGAETQKKVKTRFSDRAREAKKKQEKEKAANKRQKFVPPTETPEQLAIDKQQQSALGLRGDTTHPKKANAAKTGPKRRFSDEDKKKQEPAQGSQSATPGTTTPAGTGGTGTSGTGTGGAGTAPPAAPQS